MTISAWFNILPNTFYVFHVTLNSDTKSVSSAPFCTAVSRGPYTRGEKRGLNTFHMQNLRRILGIKWSDRITNNEVLQHAGVPSMYTLLRQHRLRWLGHVRRTAGSPETCCTESLHPAREPKVVPSSDSKT